jgi:hypothetical protein
VLTPDFLRRLGLSRQAKVLDLNLISLQRASMRRKITLNNPGIWGMSVDTDT